MRLRFAKRSYPFAFASSVLVAALCVGFVSAQNPDTLMPEASTAKARQILQQLIDAFGGPTYTDIRDSDCEGRLARFGHNGEMSGYTNFKDYWRYPDANRTEFSKKGVIINLYVGDQGWTLDKGGVSDLSAAAIICATPSSGSIRRNPKPMAYWPGIRTPRPTKRY